MCKYLVVTTFVLFFICLVEGGMSQGSPVYVQMSIFYCLMWFCNPMVTNHACIDERITLLCFSIVLNIQQKDVELVI